MVITDIRLSFVQIETLAGALAALRTPAIPYAFLLDQALYRAEIGNALPGTGARRAPWHDGFGKLFWFYYLEKKGGKYVQPAHAWKGLVPLQCDAGGAASAAWLPGTIDVRSYLYPWGIGLVVDVRARGRWRSDEAVEFAFKVRDGDRYDWTTDGGNTGRLRLKAFMDRIIASIRETAYGPAVGAGQTGEIFSVVTVLDAEDVDPTQEVPNKADLHRALDALTDWSPVWKVTALEDLEKRKIDELKRSPAGHVVYGGRRGRTVWFPAGFTSNEPMHPLGLSCYHQNLLVATLQTESLCRLMQAVAKQLNAGQTIGRFSETHRNCARLAAGTLARLYGGSLDTYRSQMMRDQIRRTYLADVNRVRGAFPGPLSAPLV